MMMFLRIYTLLSSLKILDLGGNSFRILPSFSGFRKLEFLYLNGCSNLHTIPDLPLSLVILSAYDCRSLKKWPDFANWIRYCLENCRSLIDIPRFDISPKGKWMLGANIGSILPRKNIPDWFTFIDDGPSLSFKVPQAQRARSSFIGLTVCIVYSFRPGMYEYEISVRNRSKGTSYSWASILPLHPTWEDHLWLGFLPRHQYYLEAGDQVELFVNFGSHIVKKVGAVMKEEMKKETVDRPMPYWERERSDNSQESEAEKADKIQAWKEYMKEVGVSSMEDEALVEHIKKGQKAYLVRMNDRIAQDINFDKDEDVEVAEDLKELVLQDAEKNVVKTLKEYELARSHTLRGLLQVTQAHLGAKNENAKDLPGILVKLMPLSMKLLYRYGDCMMSSEDDDEETAEIIDMDDDVGPAAAEYLFAAVDPASMGQDSISQFIEIMELSATLIIAAMRNFYATLKRCNSLEGKIAFVEPSSMTVGMGNSNLKTQVLVTRFLEESPDTFFVVLHNSGYHWTSVVINIEHQICEFVDPLELCMGDEEYWTDVVNSIMLSAVNQSKIYLNG